MFFIELNIPVHVLTTKMTATIFSLRRTTNDVFFYPSQEFSFPNLTSCYNSRFQKNKLQFFRKISLGLNNVFPL